MTMVPSTLLSSRDPEADAGPLSSSSSSPSTEQRNRLPGNYGAVPLSERSSLSSYATVEEVETAHELFEDHHAGFHPCCVFESEAWGAGVAGIGDEISNLLKNIVGSGGLSIPGGIAAFANAPSAIFPSLFVILVLGIVNAYSFSLLGRICAITKSATYSEAWERTVGRRYGNRSQLFVDFVVFGKAILGTWSFSIIIASTCTPLARYVLEQGAWFPRISSTPVDNGTSPDTAGLNASELSPDAVLVTITLFLLLPLCLSQRLGSLSMFSAIGTVGTIVTITTMTLRFFDGSYKEGGKFYGDLEPNQIPSFGTDRGASAFFSSFKSLTLVSIMTTGYIAHYNAPKYYSELKDHTTGRFNVVVTAGFSLAALTYTLTSTLGFLTFGQNSMGFILDNYSYRDPLATVARFGVAVSVVFAYPLLFHGGRDGLLSLLQTLSASPPRIAATNVVSESNVLTVLLLGTVTTLAIYVNDLTFVLSFSGATMSSLIIYIFPPIMFSALVQNCYCHVNQDTERDVKFGTFMMVLGIVLGAAGACVAVQRAFF